MQALKTIKALQKRISDLILESSSVEETLAQIDRPYTELVELINREIDEFSEKYQKECSKIEETLEILKELLPQITAGFNFSAPIELEKVPELENIFAALDTIKTTATDLKAGSSLNMPLDWLWLFDITQSKIIAHLNARFAAFIEVVLTNPQVMMSIINYLGVIKFVQPKPPTRAAS